ncbi:protein of unknown function [Nitrospina watsonii]|uniref:4Fe-4S ferredoxin-type domain-containing protein n=1 Tax=Nitrospina watsonii TaxID=1323948 RepID=A0ABN8VV17_9BACT|nr:protein of unknown function [Nitrospina watsonii]
MSNKNVCLINAEEASHSCPIVGGFISETTCLELCQWADCINDEDQVWLEYLGRVRDYCKQSLGIDGDMAIARICFTCPAHYVDEAD